VAFLTPVGETQAEGLCRVSVEVIVVPSPIESTGGEVTIIGDADAVIGWGWSVPG